MNAQVAPWVALMMAAMALGGCIEGTEDLDLPNVASIAPARGPSMDDLPPCHLEPGTIAVDPLVPPVRSTLPTQATIKTDAYGVSHIYADDAYSLWFANGYVQARDRLFQMDVLRMVGHGEAARHLGPGQLGLDQQIHRDLYTTEELQAQLDLSPGGTQLLQAYADGVNRYMAEAAGTAEWPGEFAAIGRTPPPWAPIDSAAIIAYLIGYFGVAGGSELTNLRMVGQLQDTVGEDAWEAFGDWVWLQSEDTYTSIHPDDLVLNGCEAPLDEAPTLQAAAIDAARGARTFGVPDAPLPEAFYSPEDGGIMSGFKWGSNAMVVDGSLTTTGEPMMWGAPQMGYYKPPVPYQIGLHGAGFDAVGIGVTGAPGMVIGRNEHIAWTATSGNGDQVDLVTIELAGDGRDYVWDGAVRSMDCWTVEHVILPSGTYQGAPEVLTQEVCRAHGWPVVAINEAAGMAWIAKTTTRNEELIGALKWLQAPAQTSRESFRELMGDFPFSFNYLVADHDGVAMIHTGNPPLRADGYDPRLPAPSGAAFDWTGEAYSHQMGTWVQDPSTGYIANWNNAPVHGWRAGDQGALWGPTQRVQQIEYWMQQAIADNPEGLDLEDIKWVNWQAAVHDSYALPFMPYLIEAASSDPRLDDVESALRDWFVAEVPWRDDNGDGFYDDPGHAVWDLMIHDMFERLTGDEWGPMTRNVHLAPPAAANNGDHGVGNNHMAPLLKILQGKTAHDWCDDITTTAHESCRSQLVAGLLDAQAELHDTYGTDPADWLEPVHYAQFFPFGAFEADRRPMINRGSWVQVVSMAESELSGSVLPPSNSGHVDLPGLAVATAGGNDGAHLTSELDLYWTNQYKPFPLTPGEVDAVAVSEQTLVIA